MAPAEAYQLISSLASRTQAMTSNKAGPPSTVFGPNPTVPVSLLQAGLLREVWMQMAGVFESVHRLEESDRQLVHAFASALQQLVSAPPSASSASGGGGVLADVATTHKRSRQALTDGHMTGAGGPAEEGEATPMQVVVGPPALPPPIIPVFPAANGLASNGGAQPMWVDGAVPPVPISSGSASSSSTQGHSALGSVPSDLRSAVLGSDDLLDRILSWLDAKSLAQAMVVRRQWEHNGKRDALWRCLVERDYPNTRILLYEAKLDGHFRDFYRKLDRSMELYADRTHSLNLREVFIWLDVGYCQEDQFVPLARKSLAFGTGEAFLGRQYAFVGDETSIFYCQGPGPGEALSSFFTNWSISTDVSLYDRVRRRHAVVALDVGHPTVAPINDEDYEVHNDEQDDYSNGELCVNLFATLTATRVPEADGPQVSSLPHHPASAAASATAAASSWAFRLTKIALEPCFSFGKGENSRELAIEPANSHDLISSILLMAKWA